MKKETVVILHNIRSVENVGAMFRTADAAGVNKIYLVGITPTPLDRFGRKRKDLAKSALGAEEFVVWEYKKSISQLLTKLKREKFKIIAIEQDKRSRSYRKVKPGKRTAFILGSEVEGVPESVLKKCDAIAEIPMYGKKESLNVSVAAGIALFEIIFDN